jgi:uncharacterized protein YozE (UPF0346 family)
METKQKVTNQIFVCWRILERNSADQGSRRLHDLIYDDTQFEEHDKTYYENSVQLLT